MTLLKKLELVVRNRKPKFLRHIFRVISTAFRKGQSSQPLPAHLLENCQICASRYELVKRLPKSGFVAEIGTFKGDFAEHILTVNKPEQLYLVDLDFSLLKKTVANDKRVHTHCGLSQNVLKNFDNDFFDWIYIDADHSYESCSRDARIAMRKVKPGGYLVFNDFAHLDPFLGAYGVHRAVVDFALEFDWPFGWFAYDPNGLYDVALQRPI